MLQKTEGIVLKSFRFGESGRVVKIYTEDYGLQSYLVKGMKGQKSVFKPSMLEPLTLLELEVYHKQNQSLQTIKEGRCLHAYTGIPNSMVKQSVLMFMAEVIYKCIQEEEPNSNLYSFLKQALLFLDATDEVPNLFPAYFMIQLSGHLGFYPKPPENNDEKYFDLREGTFYEKLLPHADFADENSGKLLAEILKSDLRGLANIVTSNSQRKTLLEYLILYYRIHLIHFGNIQSQQVLEMVFRG